MEPSSDILCSATEEPSEQSLPEAGRDAAQTDADLQLESPVSLRELQELMETEANRQLIQVSLTFLQILKPSLVKVHTFLPRWLRCLQGLQQQDSPEALMTTPSDLENSRDRLLSKVLSCKNQPAKLDVTAMAQQLQEAQVGLAARIRFSE